jgi:UDP-N-acetylmuramate--alanine ligase
LSEEAQVRATDIRQERHRMKFTAIVGVNGSARKLEIALNIPGLHNIQNALAAIAVANEIGVPDAAIVKALSEFKGVERRFQQYGEIRLSTQKSFTLIDDYGHHPAEMEATIKAARGAFPGQRLVVAFQPHRYTRTRDVFEGFTRVLSQVDVLLLTEVYPAGEEPIVAADSKSLARSIRVQGKVEPIYIEEVDDLPAAILDIVQDGDIVLVMGAGSVARVAPHIAQMKNRLTVVNGHEC